MVRSKSICLKSVVLFSIFVFCSVPLVLNEALGSTSKPVVIIQGVPQKTMDPAGDHITAAWTVYANMYDTLTRIGKDGRIVPGLAVSWKNISPEVWEFKLREGVKFTNGEPLNADAVKFSIDRILDPKNRLPVLGKLGALDSSEVVGEYTVRIKTKGPYAPLPSRMLVVYIVPPKHVKQMGDKFRTNPIGTGAYKLEKWVQGEHVTLVANEDHWGGVPGVKKLVFKPVPEASTRVAELLTGRADVIVNVPPELEPSIKKSKTARVVKFPTVRKIWFDFFDGHNKPFNDIRVRQAFNYAVNKDLIVKQTLGGAGENTGGAIPASIFGYNPNVKPFPYDPEKAKALLAEAGYKEGELQLVVHTPAGRYLKDKEVTQAVAGQLAKVGIKTTVDVMEYGTWRSRARQPHKWKGLWLISGSYPRGDPDDLYSQYLHKSGLMIGGLANAPKANDYVEKGRSTYDIDERIKVYQEAEEYIVKQAAWLFLYTQGGIYGLSNRLDWKPWPSGLIDGWTMKLKE